MTALQAKVYRQILKLLENNFGHALLTVVHHRDGNLCVQVATLGADDNQSVDLAKRTLAEVEKMREREVGTSIRAALTKGIPGHDPGKN